MFCKNCGAEIDEKAFCCPKCGVLTNNESEQVARVAPKKADAPSSGFAVLCFFIPLVGLILWLIWKDVTPLKAKSCGKGALIGVIASVALYVISIAITIAAAALVY